jgi:hypothetical protein
LANSFEGRSGDFKAICPKSLKINLFELFGGIDFEAKREGKLTGKNSEACTN